MDHIKETGREIETETKKQLRELDGHDLGDDLANTRDEIGMEVGNAQDRIKEEVDQLEDDLHETGDRIADEGRRAEH